MQWNSLQYSEALIRILSILNTELSENKKLELQLHKLSIHNRIQCFYENGQS